MIRSLKTIAALFLVLAIIETPFSYCADKSEAPKINQYEGRIAYLDWVASKMIVNGIGQKEFYVPKDTRMRKLGGWITFAGLNILDNVLVDYYEDPSGRNVVVHITVTVV